MIELNEPKQVFSKFILHTHTHKSVLNQKD